MTTKYTQQKFIERSEASLMHSGLLYRRIESLQNAQASSTTYRVPAAIFLLFSLYCIWNYFVGEGEILHSITSSRLEEEPSEHSSIRTESSATKEIMGKDNRTGPMNSTKWEDSIPEAMEAAIDWANFLNLHHDVLNELSYGPVVSASVDHDKGIDAVIVIQIHDERAYHQYLFESLSKVGGIERALLVFSHDAISPSTNQLIRNITYARVIQLLYPYSLQLVDRGGSKIKDASAVLAQIRQHWWWKVQADAINYIFDGVVKRYGLVESFVVLVEDDEMVAPDLLHTLRLMVAEKAKVCPECLGIKLGVNGKFLDDKLRSQYREDLDKFYVIPSSALQRGMAVDLAAWDHYRSNCSAQVFCTLREAHSLHWILHLAQEECLPNATREMWVKSARVIHVGACGMSVRAKNCSRAAALAGELLKEDHSTTGFFPHALHQVEFSGGRDAVILDEGWRDTNEHALCLLNTHPLDTELAEERLKVARLLFGGHREKV